MGGFLDGGEDGFGAQAVGAEALVAGAGQRADDVGVELLSTRHLMPPRSGVYWFRRVTFGLRRGCGRWVAPKSVNLPAGRQVRAEDRPKSGLRQQDWALFQDDQGDGTSETGHSGGSG